MRSARAARLPLEELLESVELDEPIDEPELVLGDEDVLVSVDVLPELLPEAPMPEELVLGDVLLDEELGLLLLDDELGVVLLDDELGVLLLLDDELELGVVVDEPEAPMLDVDGDEEVEGDEEAPMLEVDGVELEPAVLELALSPPAFGAVLLVVPEVPVPLELVPAPVPEVPELEPVWADA